MRPILIGAGRGSRLAHLTREIPKTLVPVMGRPMLDFILDALAAAGFTRKDVVFVCGYQADVIRARYPEFTYVHNDAWESNNILASLFYAREHMKGGFVSSYTDILYTGAVVADLARSPHPMVLGCDTKWRRRYVSRSQHPETDAEKLRAEGERVVEVSRHIASDAADGEFIGVAKLDSAGAAELAAAYDEIGPTLPRGPRSYLIELFDAMIRKGADFRRVDTPGGYMELDTLEDIEQAPRWYEEFPR